MDLDPANKETIDMVEASAFLVCLDDTEPADAEERIRDMMMLKGFNRWVDKSIAFVVCKNATSGTYVEHTCIDVSFPAFHLPRYDNRKLTCHRR
jgi:hypothetical protein